MAFRKYIGSYSEYRLTVMELKAHCATPNIKTIEPQSLRAPVVHIQMYNVRYQHYTHTEHTCSHLSLKRKSSSTVASWSQNGPLALLPLGRAVSRTSKRAFKLCTQTMGDMQLCFNLRGMCKACVCAWRYIQVNKQTCTSTLTCTRLH